MSSQCRTHGCRHDRHGHHDRHDHSDRRRNHRYHHNSASSTEKRHQIPEEDPRSSQGLEGRIEIDLVDVDESISGRPRVKIGAKSKTANLRHVASFLRRRFDGGDEAIPQDDHVEFFLSRKRLHGEALPKDVSTLWYRVVDPQDDGYPEVKWKGTQRFFRPRLDEVAQYIRSGATVGQVRRKIALELAHSPSSLDSHHKATAEPDQVLIEAFGGFRQGPVQGDNWECRNIRSWLCRCLTISLVRSEDYFVFYGFNERYLLHEPYLNVGGPVTRRSLKEWLRRRVLINVNQAGSHPGKIGVEDINLSPRGRLVRDGTRIRLGESFDFELSRDVGNAFTQAEAWLLPRTETCSICADDKRVSEMPIRRRITKDCTHEATACRDCVSQWITSSLETVSWDRLKCLECPNLLSFTDVERFAARDTFDRYDRLATKSVLDGIGGFRWCLNPECGAGQIYSPGCEKAKCYACKHYSCVRHDVPWHRGETCKDYDRRTQRQRRSRKLSEKTVRKTTKPCPGCKKDVNKYSGCDHITCVCGHEWCWLCSATYTRDRSSTLHCEHAPNCRHHGTPPFWEGRGAFFPFLEPLAEPAQPPANRRFRMPPRPPPEIPMVQAAAQAEGPARHHPDSPRLPRRNLLNLLFDEFHDEVGHRLRRQGMQFIHDEILFDLAQLMARAR
ncbi:hypothetical protein F5Y10DRAFT_113425 [Nemania abortiva]|nr:hypothetical protein F5Y10DRAFT_113425 [Nemania abortiva]